MPRRPEMAEVDHTEYVFGENGGRGAPASTFFSRIASMAPDDDDDLELQQRVVGAGYSHAERGSLKEKKPKSKSKKKSKESDSRGGSQPPGPKPGSKAGRRDSYFDLDDDWDANVEHDLVGSARIERSISSNQPGETSEAEALAECEEMNSRLSRIRRFRSVLEASTVDVAALRKLSYNGIPEELRPQTWQQLLGYLPANAERRAKTLQNKRQEYQNGIDQVFGTDLDPQMWHQISIDVPRTNPHIKLYSFEATQRALERILYLWAIRHPVSGYVQGINDLVTPFFQTFLGSHVEYSKVHEYDPAKLKKGILDQVEADAYWCLTKLLDGIQDNYIHAQPGIHRQVAMLQDICTRLDKSLVDHLHKEGVEFMQFSFRWMNCLLMREVPMNCTIRIWDTYLSEGPQGFSQFHVYVCTAFLNKWKNEIKAKDFQDIMIFLQALPTSDWGDKEVELVLSEAYLFQSLFSTGSAHLK